MTHSEHVTTPLAVLSFTGRSISTMLSISVSPSSDLPTKCSPLPLSTIHDLALGSTQIMAFSGWGYNGDSGRAGGSTLCVDWHGPGM
eukprot:372248-Amphidinium_carterae.1